jgi:uncharacterized protein YjdB
MKQTIARSLAALLLVVGCEGGPTGVQSPVSRVEIVPDSASVTVQSTLQMEATLMDGAGGVLDGRSVHWSSSDTTVAVVSSDGLVTGRLPGTVRIAASAEGVSALAKLTVAPPPVASVSVVPNRLTVFVGDTALVTATPLDGSDRPLAGRAVAWKSENPKIATVDGQGRVAGVSAGTTRVVATSEGKSATSTVTVGLQPVADVAVTPSNATLMVGQTQQLSAVASSAKGAPLTGRTVKWSSSDAAVASVDGSGLVAAVAPGTADITATVDGTPGSAVLTVTPIPVASVGVTPSTASLVVGGTQRFSATAKSAGGAALTGRTVTWSTSDAAVASVDAKGLVTGLATGTAGITATVDGINGSAVLTVTPIPVATVTVTPASASLVVGQSRQLSVTAKSAAGAPLTGRPVTWSSDDATIASVDAAGLVTAHAPGSATVLATVEGKSASSAVTVTPVPVATVAVNPPSGTVTQGSTLQLAAVAKDASGGTLTGRAVTWSSSDAAVASVDAGGLVTGLTTGTAGITATVDGVTGSAAMTVVPIPVATVTVTPATASLIVGNTQALTAVATAADGTILTGRAVIWSTSDATVASVSGSGGVTALAPGKATITATISGKSGSALISVNPVPVARVVVSPTKALIGPGATVQLQVVTEDSIGGVLTGRVVTWSSSDPNIASVDANGLVTGNILGAAAITATSETKSASAAITVGLLATTVTLVSGDNQKAKNNQTLASPLVVLVTDAGGRPVSGVTVSWTTSNGSMSPTTSYTDAAGLAASSWTLGGGPKSQLRYAAATVSGLTPVQFVARRN